MIKFILSFHFLLHIVTLHTQQFLQLETINDPESLKFTIGDQLLVKTKSNEDWQKIRLKDFIYTDSIILIEEGFIKLSDITQLRDTRPIVNNIARGAQTFGTAYLIYGLLGSLSDSGQKFQLSDAVFGAGVISLGWIFRKAFYIRDYKMGNRYRLRLLDLRMRSN